MELLLLFLALLALVAVLVEFGLALRRNIAAVAYKHIAAAVPCSIVAERMLDFAPKARGGSIQCRSNLKFPQFYVIWDQLQQLLVSLLLRLLSQKSFF